MITFFLFRDSYRIDAGSHEVERPDLPADAGEVHVAARWWRLQGPATELAHLDLPHPVEGVGPDVDVDQQVLGVGETGVHDHVLTCPTENITFLEPYNPSIDVS